jgi:hypothetical protein
MKTRTFFPESGRGGPTDPPKQSLDGDTPAPQFCGRRRTCAKGAAAWTACPEPSRRASPQKTAPVFGGGQVALVLSCCESFIGGRTAGGPSVRERASGGGFAAYAAPHLTRTTCHGETWSPGPPNCFPSTECARCLCVRGPACCRRPRPAPRWEHCRVRRSACGRRESDVL